MVTIFRQISWGIHGSEVAPALEGMFQAALDADHPGVKNNGTAANTVLTRSFIEADYSLAALDSPLIPQ